MKKQTLPELFTLTNVDIWNADSIRTDQNIIVDRGVIREIVPSESNKQAGEIIEGGNSVLIPSGVDAHVHLRVPGQPQKETAETGLLAAARGGYGAVLNMPNTVPPTDDVATCELAMNELDPAMAATGVAAYLSGCITKGMKGQELVDVDALAEWGVKTFTDDGLGVESDRMMRDVFSAASRWNIPVSQHAEYCGHGGILAGGRTQHSLSIPQYPASAEYDMVARDLRELKRFPDTRYHVLHVSLGKTVELVNEARAEGYLVSCEVTPHHLYYTFNEIPESDTSFKMNPPLRDGYDRRVMQRGIQNGDIAFVATDHAPHAEEEKGKDFNKAAFGTTGMETSLRVLFDLLDRNEMDEMRLVQVFSTEPARYLGIDHNFGALDPGRPFHAVLVDPYREASPIELGDLASKSHNNVFVGRDLPGALLRTFNPGYHFEL